MDLYVLWHYLYFQVKQIIKLFVEFRIEICMSAQTSYWVV